MDTESIWGVIRAERESLSTDLSNLTDEQWATPSWCDNWTVRDAVAHMTAAATSSPKKFFGALASSGFKFESVQSKGIAAALGSSPADTLAKFRAIESSRQRPPGPVLTMLGETLVHAADIRRPLGISHQYPTDALVAAGGFFAKSNLIIGTKSRIAGLTLQATDAEWSFGSGPEVAGPMSSLLLAMTGRKGALVELTGPGVSTLSSRP